MFLNSGSIEFRFFKLPKRHPERSFSHYRGDIDGRPFSTLYRLHSTPPRLAYLAARPVAQVHS